MKRFVLLNPFLTAGILGIVLLGVWLVTGPDPDAGGASRILFVAWRTLAAPVHVAANALAPVTDRWPDALDTAAVVIVGIAPYLVADLLWRRVLRRRWSKLRPS